jgi:hypothetical protein
MNSNCMSHIKIYDKTEKFKRGRMNLADDASYWRLSIVTCVEITQQIRDNQGTKHYFWNSIVDKKKLRKNGLRLNRKYFIPMKSGNLKSTGLNELKIRNITYK